MRTAIERLIDEAATARARMAELEEALRDVTTYIFKCRKPDNCALCRAREVLDHE